jgi:WD40 repeat protein
LIFKKTSLVACLLLFIAIVSACQTQPNQVFIEVDGARQALVTEVTTVRDALQEAEVELGNLDHVDPDLYVQLESGLTIVVTRVTEEIVVEREIIPFERQTVVNEALAAGETRLAQLGVNGEDEISIRAVYEDGQEVRRVEISRVSVVPPVPEILVVGPQDTLPSVQIDGTVTYIANGNAWLIRDSSSSRRALTTAGNLDGQVFSLSPDGRQLVYTTELTKELELPLNEMWLASTTIVGEAPVKLGLDGVLQAQWSPVITESLIAYSTAERSPNPPGWRANNDLWLLALPDSSEIGQDSQGVFAEPVEILASNTEGLYPWWGTTIAWSPDGSKIAYARADQIGVIDLAARSRSQPNVSISSDDTTPLIDFTPLQTFSDWVWVPGLAWSPDGRFIAAAVHGPPLASEPEAESQVFDLWLLSVDGSISAQVVDQVGMWSNPAWGEAGIAFGEAINPLQSANSRYEIQLIDKDGSNKRQIFPFGEELGVRLPELVWSPGGQELLFVYNGDLHVTSVEGGVPRRLSNDGQTNHPQWALAQRTALTGTSPITPGEGVTGSPQISATSVITPTPTPAGLRLQVTPTTTPTRRSTPAGETPAPASPAPTPSTLPRTATIQATRALTGLNSLNDQ